MRSFGDAKFFRLEREKGGGGGDYTWNAREDMAAKFGVSVYTRHFHFVGTWINEMILWTHCFLYMTYITQYTYYNGVCRSVFMCIIVWDTLPSVAIKQRDYAFQLSNVN